MKRFLKVAVFNGKLVKVLQDVSIVGPAIDFQWLKMKF